MRILSRLLLLLVLAAGFCWPAQPQLREGEPPCSSQAVFLAGVPGDPPAASRASAGSDWPCNAKATEASRSAVSPRSSCEPVVYTALWQAERGLSVEAIDSPPRS